MMCAFIAMEKGHWKRECPQLLCHPGMFVVEINMISNSASWVLDTGCGAHICNDLQVLQRSRKLSKNEMILRLGNGEAVAAEAVGSLSLVVSNHVRIELKDCYFVTSMGKMTKKPFVGQSAIAKGLLDLVHTDVCGPLSVPARGGFSYFITFTDDHSRNEWTPPGTPQLNRVAERRNRTLLDMVRSMMSFMELPPSFWGHALETAVKLLNISPSKSIPQTPYEIWHGKPASYKYLRVWGSPVYVKRLVGDKLDSRSSLCRFIGYPKETAGYYFYDPTEQKVFVSRNAMFLEKDFPSDNQRDEVLIEESSGESPHDSTAPFEPIVHSDSVPILRRSTRESRVPERYGFVGLTSHLDNDPKTYGEAMSDIDSDKWLEAMKSEMDSMGSNQVWTLVDPPKGVRPVGCKWVYKCKLRADGEVTAFKVRLVAKGYTQPPYGMTMKYGRWT
ncbi:UNVERIFIED_CONTAM: hypothetical protein Sradi_2068900 [Sesamum radiatum]|uniref:Integrase catalytic domain-containing protein n=1 Tax=Sesamum radiatum TaxID=300843 RepID=A0AAW2TL13_SESRA